MVLSFALASKDRKKGGLEGEKVAVLGLCVAPPIGLELEKDGEISRISPRALEPLVSLINLQKAMSENLIYRGKERIVDRFARII